MKKCILYENKVCNDCGECLGCDLDPNKLCDNCGRCIEPSDDREFLSMIVHAPEHEEVFDDVIVPLTDKDIESLSDEEKQLLAFLDAPIDLHIPEPISIDRELHEKWERILASDTVNTHNANKELTFKKADVSYGIRNKRKK